MLAPTTQHPPWPLLPMLPPTRRRGAASSDSEEEGGGGAGGAGAGAALQPEKAKRRLRRMMRETGLEDSEEDEGALLGWVFGLLRLGVAGGRGAVCTTGARPGWRTARRTRVGGPLGRG